MTSRRHTLLEIPPVLPPDAGLPPCAMDPDRWFPDKHTAREDRRLVLRICKGCYFRDACRSAGRDGDEQGVWGGETRRQRTINKRKTKAS